MTGAGPPEDEPGEQGLFVGYDTGLSAELAAALGRTVTSPPAIPDPVPGPDPGTGGWGWTWSPAFAAWGESLRSGPPADSVVVCTWDELSMAEPLVEQGAEAWVRHTEAPLALWFTAIVAAAERCRDGGSVVVVVELPGALDVEGRADLVAVGEGVTALARSAALVQGERGVRVNVVATELVTAPATLPGMAPALPTFPGRVALEVAGAVRMLTSSDAAGVTGTVVRADCGRDW